MTEPGVNQTRLLWSPSWRFPVRRMLPSLNQHTPPLRLQVLQSSSASCSCSSSSSLDHEKQHEHNSSYSTVGDSVSSSSSSLDEPHRDSRRVRFASTLEREIRIVPSLDATSSSCSDSSASSSSCCWYTRDELAQLELERRLELNALTSLASSRGLAAYRRRVGDNKAFGRVLYRLLLRFRHDGTSSSTTTAATALANDNKTKEEDKHDDDDHDDDEKEEQHEHDDNDVESFAIDHADFKLLQRYIARYAFVTGMERNVTESVASETRALIGNVQQSVLMVQDMLVQRQKGGGGSGSGGADLYLQQHNDHVDECLRCASIRYSAPSQRLARALGEVHSQVVNAPGQKI